MVQLILLSKANPLVELLFAHIPTKFQRNMVNKMVYFSNKSGFTNILLD